MCSLTHASTQCMHVLACTHFAATMPVDVVKVRMQYAGADGNKLYNGISDCIVKTAKVVRSRALVGLAVAIFILLHLCLRERCRCAHSRDSVVVTHSSHLLTFCHPRALSRALPFAVITGGRPVGVLEGSLTRTRPPVFLRWTSVRNKACTGPYTPCLLRPSTSQCSGDT
jgi:hypothetical protein